MKVWVVFLDACAHCEGSEVLSVHASEAGALAAKVQAEADRDERAKAGDHSVCHRSSVAFQEAEVQP